MRDYNPLGTAAPKPCLVARQADDTLRGLLFGLRIVPRAGSISASFNHVLAIAANLSRVILRQASSAKAARTQARLEAVFGVGCHDSLVAIVLG
jgi:hypothetical protein